MRTSDVHAYRTYHTGNKIAHALGRFSEQSPGRAHTQQKWWCALKSSRLFFSQTLAPLGVYTVDINMDNVNSTVPVCRDNQLGNSSDGVCYLTTRAIVLYGTLRDLTYSYLYTARIYQVPGKSYTWHVPGLHCAGFRMYTSTGKAVQACCCTDKPTP